MDAVALAPTVLSAGHSSRFDQTRHIGRRPVTLATIGQILRWRWRLVLGIVLVALLAGGAASLIITPRYQGIARIRITPVGAFPLATDDTHEQPLDQAMVNTEIGTIRSRDIARKVVQQFGLEKDPEFVPARLLVGTAPTNHARATEAAISDILDRLSVEQQEKSYIVAIGFDSPDALKAARVANGFASAYIDNTADVVMSTAARQAATGQAALQRLSQQAEVAASSVAQYRASSGIEQGGGGITISDQQIGPLAMQLAQSQAQAAAARSNVEAAEKELATGGADAVSAVLSSSVIADLRSRRTEAEGQRAQYAARYGPRFPALVQSNEQIASLDQQIRQEQGRIIEGLKNEARAADAQVASLRGQLGELKGQIATNNQAAVRAESLQRDADAATGAYNHLASSVQQTTQAERANEPQARLIEQAVVAAHPTFPNRPAMISASLLIGLILGFAGALVTEGMQATLRHADDVESLLGVPFISAIPQLSRRSLQAQGGQDQPANTLLHRPVSAFSEAFRSIRTTLRGQHDPSGLVVSISSTLPSEGKSTSALALARVMAMCGDRVLLVDGDVRRAGLAKMLGIDVPQGVVEVLLGEAEALASIVPDAVPGLDLLLVREPSFTPVDLFSGNAMKAELAKLRARYDYVILDTPPLLGVADARTLAKLADGVLVMVRWGVTPIAAVDAALAGLEQDGSAIIGAVLTMVDPTSEAMGGAYYSSHYNAYYAS
jgi:capsular exopolysaccharide synthesis family protein